KNGDIKALNGLKMGYIKGEENNEWILNFLKSKDINVNLVYAPSCDELEQLLKEKKVDFIVLNKDNNAFSKNSDIKCIFNFSAGPAYIVSKKGDTKLIDKIDKVLGETDISNSARHKDLYSKYFNKYIKKIKVENLFIIIFLIPLSIIFIKKIKANIKLRKNKRRIIENLNNNNFLLYYQPIVNARNSQVVGFEALSRLKYNEK
ncbi:EAL domain-containing protein, partial [Clostridium perfringens]|nr:EAL domain-containing protein [Clostridium perfringens]